MKNFSDYFQANIQELLGYPQNLEEAYRIQQKWSQIFRVLMRMIEKIKYSNKLMGLIKDPDEVFKNKNRWMDYLKLNRQGAHHNEEIQEKIDQYKILDLFERFIKKYGDFFLKDKKGRGHIKKIYVAAVDISYVKRGNKEIGVASAVLQKLDDLKNNQKDIMYESKIKREEIKFPYKPGVLAFREVPLSVKAVLSLKRRPDILLCDGHGQIHNELFGLASHLGFALNILTIGLAKSMLYANNLSIRKDWRMKIKSDKFRRPIPIYFRDNYTFKEDKNKFHKNPKWRYNLYRRSQRKKKVGFCTILPDRRSPIFLSPGFGLNLSEAYNFITNYELLQTQDISNDERIKIIESPFKKIKKRHLYSLRKNQNNTHKPNKRKINIHKQPKILYLAHQYGKTYIREKYKI
ncbi:MAG: endonuclease V [Promethearchaeota archaeon]